MRPRRRLTKNQSLAIAMLQTGHSDTEMATEFWVSSTGCNRDIEKLEESQKGVEVDVLWPHPVLMTATLWTLDDECFSTPGTNKEGERHPIVRSDYFKPFTSVWSVLDDLHRYLTTPKAQTSRSAFTLDEGPVDLRAVLWLKSIHAEQKRCWRRQGELHQPLLSPAFGGGGVTVWTEVSRTVLHFVNGTVTSPHLNNIINPVIVPLHEQHRPNVIFTDDRAPAHRGHHQWTAVGDWCLSNGTTWIHWKPVRSAESCRGSKLCTRTSTTWGCPSTTVGSHASAENKLTYEQHETSRSSCN